MPMNKYKLSWVPSVSDFAASQDIIASINGLSEAPIATDIAMTPGTDGRCSHVHDFNDGDTIVWWVRTHGDNNTQSDSAADTFQAINAETVAPATALQHTFIQHMP